MSHSPRYEPSYIEQQTPAVLDELYLSVTDPIQWLHHQTDWAATVGQQILLIKEADARSLAEYSIRNSQVVFNHIQAKALSDPDFAAQLPALEHMQARIMDLKVHDRPLELQYRLRIFMALAVFFRDNEADIAQTVPELEKTIDLVPRMMAARPSNAVDVYSYFNPTGHTSVAAFNALIAFILKSPEQDFPIVSLQHMIQSRSYTPAQLSELTQAASGGRVTPLCLLAFYYCPMVQALPTIEQRVAQVARMADTLQEYGIEYFHRYTPVLLENAYRTATDPDFMNGRKTALVILNKSDWNTAFEYFYALGEKLDSQKYGLILSEAGDENEVADRFFHSGLRAGSSSTAPSRPYDLLVLGGHGNPTGINFGKAPGEFSNLDVWDFDKNNRFTKDAWEGRFSPNAAIILDACSTGANGQTYGTFQNIMQMVGVLSNRKVFAPPAVSGDIDIKFDLAGVKSVQYYCSGEDGQFHWVPASVYAPPINK